MYSSKLLLLPWSPLPWLLGDGIPLPSLPPLTGLVMLMELERNNGLLMVILGCSSVGMPTTSESIAAKGVQISAQTAIVTNGAYSPIDPPRADERRRTCRPEGAGPWIWSTQTEGWHEGT